MTETQLLNETFQYIVDKGPAEAHSYIDKHYLLSESPHSSRVYNLRFCLAAACGQSADALRLIKEAVWDRKLWYRPEVFDDVNLKSLADDAVFIQCRQESDLLYQQAKAKAKTLCTWNRVKSDSLMLALHGNTQSNEDSKKVWSFAEGFGWQVEYVQSKEIDSIGLYRWDADGSGPYQLEAVCGNIGWFDYDRRALAGFDSGCNVILRAIAAGMLECELLLLHEPLAPMLNKSADSLYRNLVSAGTRVVLSCGTDDDEALEWSQMLNNGCEAAGISVQYTEIEGLAHEFPKDFEKLIGSQL